MASWSPRPVASAPVVRRRGAGRTGARHPHRGRRRVRPQPHGSTRSARGSWPTCRAGRFRLGLGTQVRAHAQRRYGVALDPPGPRLEGARAGGAGLSAAFRGDAPLDFHGSFHELTFINLQWSPGRLDVADPPVDVAGVNPWMLRMAGRVADGLHVHPLGHPGYLKEVALPEVAAEPPRPGDH